MRRVAAVVLAVALMPALGGCVSVLDVIFPEAGPEEPYVPSAEELVVPERFTIIPDPWQAEFVGTLADERRFFLHPTYCGDATCLAVFYWNADGTFESIDVDEVPEFADLDEALDARFERLDGAEIDTVTVAPFSIDHEGEEFGFVARGPDPAYEGDIASVILLPANDMVYYWPWDGEGYDT